jgi:hypothetical protein
MTRFNEHDQKSGSTIILTFALSLTFAGGLTVVKADSTFPILISPVHIETPTNRTYTSGVLTLNASFGGFCFDIIKHSLTYSLDGNDMGAMPIVPNYTDYLSVQAGFTASVQLPQLSKGQHSITVYAEHDVYNFTSNGVFYPKITQQDNATVIFNISDTIPINELTPPVISALTIQNRTYASSALLLNFTVDKAVSSTSYCLDGRTTEITDWWNTPASMRSFNVTLKGLTEGTHTFVVYAEDTFGNTASSDSINFAVDTTAPNVTILSIENKTYTSASAPLNFAVNESVSHVTYSLDGKENVSIAGNSTLTGLPDGVHNVTVYAWDPAGNIGVSATTSFKVKADEFSAETFAFAFAASATFVGAGLFLYFKKHRR